MSLRSVSPNREPHPSSIIVASPTSVSASPKRRSTFFSLPSPVRSSWNPIKSSRSSKIKGKNSGHHSSSSSSPVIERSPAENAAEELLANFRKSMVKDSSVVVTLQPPLSPSSSSSSSSSSTPLTSSSSSSSSSTSSSSPTSIASVVASSSFSSNSYELRGASLNKLIGWVLAEVDEHASEDRDLRTLLLTYRSFVTPLQLFNTLVEVYKEFSSLEVNQGQIGVHLQTKIKKKVFFFLKEWVDHYSQDFDGKAGPGVLTLQNVLKLVGESFPTEDVNHFKLMFVKSKQVNKNSGSRVPTIVLRPSDDSGPNPVSLSTSPMDSRYPLSTPSSPVSTPPISSSSLQFSPPTGSSILSQSPESTPPLSLSLISSSSPNFSSFGGAPSPPAVSYLLDMKSTHLAEQMTLLEEELILRVRRVDLLRFGDKDKSPILKALSDRFNQVSLWVASQILLARDLKGQISVTKKFIKIGGCLLNLHNYNTLMQILAGLSNTAVIRLKTLQENIPADFKEDLNKLEDFMSPLHNFKNYRNAEKPAQHIPYFALILRDLTFIQDGNQDYLSDGVINFEKQRMFVDLIDSIPIAENSEDLSSSFASLFQSNSLTRSFLSNLRFFDEDTLYGLSLKQEAIHSGSVISFGSGSIGSGGGLVLSPSTSFTSLTSLVPSSSPSPAISPIALTSISPRDANIIANLININSKDRISPRNSSPRSSVGRVRSRTSSDASSPTSPLLTVPGGEEGGYLDPQASKRTVSFTLPPQKGESGGSGSGTPVHLFSPSGSPTNSPRLPSTAPNTPTPPTRRESSNRKSETVNVKMSLEQDLSATLKLSPRPPKPYRPTKEGSVKNLIPDGKVVGEEKEGCVLDVIYRMKEVKDEEGEDKVEIVQLPEETETAVEGGSTTTTNKTITRLAELQQKATGEEEKEMEEVSENDNVQQQQQLGLQQTEETTKTAVSKRRGVPVSRYF